MLSQETVRTELEKLIEVNGEGILLRPESVVDAARLPDHPLHGCFTWDDSEAAERWRVEQARRLIRSVRVSNPDALNHRPTPVFVSLMSDREDGGYRRTSDVLADEDLIAELRRTAEAELRSWMERHAVLVDMIKTVAEATGVVPDPMHHPRSHKVVAGAHQAT